MRLRNLAAAGALGASLLALATSTASAEKHPSPNGRCNVNINLGPRLIETGESVLVFGRLTCSGSERGAAGGKIVRLLQHAVGIPGFRLVASTTTDRRGFYELTRAGVEGNSTFYVTAHGAASGVSGVRVLARVTVLGPPEGAQLLTGPANKVTFSGTVSPHDAGALAVLQRQNADSGDDWHRIDLSHVAADGSYSITHKFDVPGDANIRVLIRSQRRNAPSPSLVLTYEISQAQNQQLTIAASADPITFGQSVTISGVAAGAALTPMTLLAHTAHQQGFAPVAEVKTDSNGNYSFPASSPVASTFYQVRGAGRLSAVLYEGVRDALSAQVSATTVTAGQPLTFIGNVAPDHTGHVIYLERQDRVGTDFHVVQVATVGAGSSYKIVHTIFDPGTAVLRVKIPGGPENGGAASPPFTIHVTPAPASRLRPEGPVNSAQPGEGEV